VLVPRSVSSLLALSIRPRYSLLTLLLLTAAVGYGVKLWRGPHRLDLTAMAGFDPTRTPPPPEVQHWLEQMPIRPNIACSSSHTDYQLEYLNNGNQPQILSVRGRFHFPHYLTNVGEQLWIRPQTEADTEIPFKHSETFDEQIACFVFAKPAMSNAKQLSISGQVNFFLPGGKNRPIEQELFFVLTDKRVYQLLHTKIRAREAKQVALAQIADPNIRARIAEELAKIPDPQ
jgi:hypothetical protein